MLKNSIAVLLIVLAFIGMFLSGFYCGAMDTIEQLNKPYIKIQEKKTPKKVWVQVESTFKNKHLTILYS